MATYSAGVALAFTYEVADGTTGSYTPGGDDRAVFGTIVCGGFSGLPSITELRYGGSGGTIIDRVGSDLTWVGGNGSHGVFAEAPGPTGSTTLFGDWAGTPLQSAIAAIHYTGVDQTTPFSGHVDATPTFVSSVTTTVASVTVTGCTAGQTIVAAVGALSDGVVLSAFTAVSGTTLRVSDVTGTFVGVAMLEKVATGSSETLSVNVNGSSSAGLYWTARGARVNDASGGGPTYTLAADGGTYSLSGTSNVLTAGRAIGAEAGSFSLSGTAVTLTAGRMIAADGGTFSLTGTAAALTAARVLVASGGTYSLTGQDATLTYTPAGSTYDLTADAGEFTYSGTDAALVVSRVLTAGPGSFSYSGAEAQIEYSGAPRVVGGGGGRRGKQKPRYKIVPQLPVQQEPEELPGEAEEYLEPSVALPLDQFGDEVDGRIILVNADIAVLAAELDKKQAQAIRQIQDFEDILLYL